MCIVVVVVVVVVVDAAAAAAATAAAAAVVVLLSVHASSHGTIGMPCLAWHLKMAGPKFCHCLSGCPSYVAELLCLRVHHSVDDCRRHNQMSG